MYQSFHSIVLTVHSIGSLGLMDPYLLCVTLVFYYTVLSVPCSLVVTCWERADLLAILCGKFPCVVVTFPYGVLGQALYLVVTVPDICCLYFSLCC